MWSIPALGIPALAGIAGSTKLLMFQPLFAYAATCFFFGFHFSRKSLVTIAGAAVLAVAVLAPLAQIGRYAFAGMSTAEALSGAFDLVADQILDGDGISGIQDMAQTSGEAVYYDAEVGLLNRFSLIGASDRLIDTTMNTSPEGLYFALMQMPILPRSLFGEGAETPPNNYLGYKAGFVSMHDTQTSIAFGVFADAFAVEGWIGAALLPFLGFALVFLCHRLIGDGLTANPFAIFLLIELQHSFAEASVGYLVFYCIRLLPVYLGMYLFVIFAARMLTKAFSPALRTQPSIV